MKYFIYDTQFHTLFMLAGAIPPCLQTPALTSETKSEKRTILKHE